MRIILKIIKFYSLFIVISHHDLLFKNNLFSTFSVLNASYSCQIYQIEEHIGTLMMVKSLIYG